jgi:acyl-CoA synthetase (NDP forming)
VLGLRGLTAELRHADGQTVPAFGSLEDAVSALALAVGHARWAAAAHGRLTERSGIDHHGARADAAALLATTPAGAERELDPGEAAALLARYGVHVWRSIPAAGPDEAVAAAQEIGWPVAVKTQEPSLRHRLDLGGVRLDVGNELELREALAHLAALPGGAVGRAGGVEVQAMAPRGVACVVRAIEDALYGPVVSFGLAGDAVELLEDVAYRIPPLTDADVADMIRAVRAAPRLLGRDGAEPCDLAALEDVVSRVASLKDDLPELASVVLNPVVVGSRGAAVLEARVVLAHPSRRDRARRVLPA